MDHIIFQSEAIRAAEKRLRGTAASLGEQSQALMTARLRLWDGNASATVLLDELARHANNLESAREEAQRLAERLSAVGESFLVCERDVMRGLRRVQDALDAAQSPLWQAEADASPTGDEPFA